MIVKNEASNLADALSSFKSFADEIVVVDTGSTDGTRDIAVKFTPHVYDFEWIDDFGAARNFAMSKAKGRYQLWLDADDRVSPENQGHINKLKSLFDGRKAFYFVLENHQLDTGRNSCLQLRCTPLSAGIRFEGRIHEQLYPSALREGLELVNTDIVIQHFGYMTEEARIAKARRNLGILERERARGRHFSGVYFYLALTHAPLGNKEESISCMLTALELLNKENMHHHLIPEGYIFLAKLSLETDDPESSLRYLIKARSVVNGNPSHNFQIGILFQRMGRHAEAISCFQEVDSRQETPQLFPTLPLPNHPEIMLHMAYSHFCMNERQKALQLINASGTETSDPGRSWEWLGRKAFAFQNMGLAQLAFETAQRFGGLEACSWDHLAAIYKLRGFLEKSEQCRIAAAAPQACAG